MSAKKAFVFLLVSCLSLIRGVDLAASHASVVSGEGYRYGYKILHGPGPHGHSVGESFPHGYGGYGSSYAPAYGYGYTTPLTYPGPYIPSFAYLVPPQYLGATNYPTHYYGHPGHSINSPNAIIPSVTHTILPTVPQGIPYPTYYPTYYGETGISRKDYS